MLMREPTVCALCFRLRSSAKTAATILSAAAILSTAFASACSESIAATVLSATAVVSFVFMVLANLPLFVLVWPSGDHAAVGQATVGSYS